MVKETLTKSDYIIIMNDLNMGEVYPIVARHRGIEQADHFVEDILQCLPIKVLSGN
ncbi:MAG: hypothetical protein M1381_06100 [Deltaproteobacteria bacterium]|nr:hypothetical protein [Deltaproteobacteria bacterium]